MEEIKTFTHTTDDDGDFEVVSKDEYTKQGEDHKAQLEELQAKLDVELEKDKNFKALREKKGGEITKEEKESMSIERAELTQLRADVEAKINGFTSGQVENHKSVALQELGVVDEEGQKNVLAAFARLNDPEGTQAEISQKMMAAFSIAFQGKVPTGQREVSAAIPFGGTTGAPKTTGNYADTEAGKGLAAQLGLKIEEDKK